TRPADLTKSDFLSFIFSNLVVVEQILETFVCSIPPRNLERLIRIAKLLRKIKIRSRLQFFFSQ
ncbi:hypothetical protein, partial [Parasutterella excrementihominis]|uniref:hypothetical protein n=1 Tax=Parasutterella excrementihominis TaxID=487175 RepID=UPI00242ABC70